MTARALALGAGAAALLMGCGVGCGAPVDGSAKAQEAPAKKPRREAGAPELARSALGEYRSTRFDLRLPLPDGARWRVEDQASPWLEATHAGTSTKLLVRAWPEAGRANRAACEARARLWRDLPAREAADIVDRRRIDVPPSFDTIVEVGVIPENNRPPNDLAIDGFVLAFGGWAHRCFAFVLTTRATGKDAERLVAERLATMVELSLQNITVERATEPDLPREPSPALPRSPSP